MTQTLTDNGSSLGAGSVDDRFREANPMTPTHEQIEAQLRIRLATLCMAATAGNDGDMAAVTNQIISYVTALTAAAGVGEKKPMTNLEWEIANNLCVIRETAAAEKLNVIGDPMEMLVDRTIERCAQWLEDKYSAVWAAEMRSALKDKP